MQSLQYSGGGGERGTEKGADGKNIKQTKSNSRIEFESETKWGVAYSRTVGHSRALGHKVKMVPWKRIAGGGGVQLTEYKPSIE